MEEEESIEYWHMSVSSLNGFPDYVANRFVEDIRFTMFGTSVGVTSVERKPYSSLKNSKILYC